MKLTLRFSTVAILVLLSGCKKQGESLFDTLFGVDQGAQEREERLIGVDQGAQEREERLINQEQKEQLAREKEDTVGLRTTLTPLIKTRKQRIKGEVDNLIGELKAISADRRELDKAMSLVEDKRGLEYTVFNIMTNEALNAIAVKYTGSDFNALRSEFVEAVRFHKTSHTELAQNLKKNREDYRRQVAGVDQDVDEANDAARDSISSTHERFLKKIAELEQRKSAIDRRLSGSKAEKEIKIIDEQLERLYEVLAVSSGSSLHLKATSLETGARRKYDVALEDKTGKDAEALKESQFKGDLYNAAQDYRGRSLDRIVSAMTTQTAILSERLNAAETILRDLEDSEERMSLMEYPDLIKLRENIANDARLKIEDGLNIRPKVPVQTKRTDS